MAEEQRTRHPDSDSGTAGIREVYELVDNVRDDLSGKVDGLRDDVVGKIDDLKDTIASTTLANVQRIAVLEAKPDPIPLIAAVEKRVSRLELSAAKIAGIAALGAVVFGGFGGYVLEVLVK